MTALTNPRILVVIPSRLDRASDGEYFLTKAIKSIVGQQLTKTAHIDIAVGIDPGGVLPDHPFPPYVKFFVGRKASQAAALNVASRQLDHDLIAFLEDDDEWTGRFLDTALKALGHADFVSSTQLEVNHLGTVICINDFPTPSGWIMHRRVWDQVGEFDESYRFHLDNDWLGRLAATKATRIHLVESTAPVMRSLLSKLRPSLHSAATQGGNVKLSRHPYPVPLVRRLVHNRSGMGLIRNDPTLQTVSRAEYERLHQRFGRLPW